MKAFIGTHIVVVLAMLLPGDVGAARQVKGAEPSGPLVVAGNGPELNLIRELGRAYEKAYRFAYVDIQWHEHLKPLELVREGEADLAVTGKEEPDLKAWEIGWDGIAVMVDLSNDTTDLAMEDIARIYSGKVKYWSELGGPDTKIVLIDRPPNLNIRHAFVKRLGIDGQIPKSAEVIERDVKATNKIVGTLRPRSAVTYMSLGPALEAVKTGVSVRLLFIDKVEPEHPTLRDGRYTLRRPILLLSRKKQYNPNVEAFYKFALSAKGQHIIAQLAYAPINTTH